MPEHNQPHDAANSGVETVRSELARLQSLIGPDETSYLTLKTELWAARDLLIGVEAELGNERGRALVLQRELLVRDRELAAQNQAPASLPAQSSLAALLRTKAVRLRIPRH